MKCRKWWSAGMPSIQGSLQEAPSHFISCLLAFTYPLLELQHSAHFFKKPILCVLMTERSLSLFSSHVNPTHVNQGPAESIPVVHVIRPHPDPETTPIPPTAGTPGSWWLSTESLSLTVTWPAQRKLTFNEWIVVGNTKAWPHCPNSGQLWRALGVPSSCWEASCNYITGQLHSLPSYPLRWIPNTFKWKFKWLPCTSRVLESSLKILWEWSSSRSNRES